MVFWCYMVRCSDGSYYTGHSDDLERRIGQHQAGGFCDYTSRRRPVEHVWSQPFPSRVEALEAERSVGGWSRAKKEALIRGDWKSVSFHARPPRERVSTSLDTNGEAVMRPNNGEAVTRPNGEDMRRDNLPSALDGANPPFASSDVNLPVVSGGVNLPFASSEVEKRSGEEA